MSSRNRQRVRLLTLALSVLVLISLNMTTANAYVRDGGACDMLTTFKFRFDGPGWTSTLKGRFRTAADAWEAVQKPTGGKVVNAYESSSGIPVRIDNNTSDTTSCGKWTGNLSYMSLRTEGRSNNDFQGVATHEVGHAIGMDHSGQGASFDGAVPTMATCTSSSQLRSLEQDDYANAVANRYSDGHANVSFENGFSFWGKGSTGSVAIIGAGGSGGSDGPSYLRMYGYGGYVYQTVRITDPGDLNARVNIKKWSSTDEGHVVMILKARRVDFSQATWCDEFLHGWDLNNPQFTEGTSFVTRASKAGFPTTSWTWTDTPTFDTPNSWEAADVRIYLYNNMKTYAGGSTYLRVDRFRARNI